MPCPVSVWHVIKKRLFSNSIFTANITVKMVLKIKRYLIRISYFFVEKLRCISLPIILKNLEFSVSHEKAILRNLEIFSEEKCRDFLKKNLARILEPSLKRFQRENESFS